MDILYLPCTSSFSSISAYAESSTISDITLSSASSISYTLVTSTIGYQHTSKNEEARKGGIYDWLFRGYCSDKLINLKRRLTRNLWFFNGCSRFNNNTYYCQQFGRDRFSTHHDSLVCLP